MRLTILLFSVFLICSCSKEADPTEGVIAVHGVLRTNSVNQKIQVVEINNDGFNNTPISGAIVLISNNGIDISLEETDRGVYEYNGLDFEVLPGETYFLTVKVDLVTLTSQTTLPPAVEVVSQTMTIFPVDTSSSGEIVFTTEWVNEGEYAQVVDLFSIEDNPTEIPYDNEIEDFDLFYAFPIPNSSLILKDLNFKYYGQHVLTINLINKDYEEFFFYSTDVTQSDIPEGLDNIEGGEGFFSGVSREQILLEILEN